ncbi:AraC family transcriptional regulator [Pseudomonas sp. EpS/L25]|uniref:AraC family transcriptional regulator n=1 Tax=Pseudomonas sp. EpS/L25 TaxID=1749078 RepID=UPI00074348DD|nr:AraC family transcriptional regulator [Pseudomonas sp. EpS/L25]KUM44019.1 AraC family transcriptional regulator [Pseudomonas sp. EpS/L25]
MSPTTPRFWRDPALPFLEARAIADGRGLCYAPHSHETFSVGVVLGGESRYVNGPTREWVGRGTLVLMNPGEVHACNPRSDQAWRYLMLYLDPGWLAAVQGRAGSDFQPLAAQLAHDPCLTGGLVRLYRRLLDVATGPLERQSHAWDYASTLLERLGAPRPPLSDAADPPRLRLAADYLADRCAEAISLDDLSQAVGLSPTHLIRSFKRRYGLTPHAYLIDQRIRLARQRLRQGEELAEVALATGFADQAHLQRTFKRLVAATPGQYRSGSALPQQ